MKVESRRLVTPRLILSDTIWYVAGLGWYTPLIPALAKQRQVDLCESETSLVYRVSSRTGSKAAQWNLSSKTIQCGMYPSVADFSAYIPPQYSFTVFTTQRLHMHCIYSLPGIPLYESVVARAFFFLQDFVIYSRHNWENTTIWETAVRLFWDDVSFGFSRQGFAT